MRDLNREAWFLYQVTSIEHFERCAQVCQEFAKEWTPEYYDTAKEIRRRIELVKLGDYMPMISELGSVGPSWRGIEDRIDSRMSKETEEALNAAFDRMSTLSANAYEAMRSNEWAGITWLEREERKDEENFLEMLDRDDGFVGEAYEWYVNRLQEMGFLPKPDHYPQYQVDKTRSCRPGETCPWTGVWIPEPALTEGLEKFSLAFAVAGRPMQPVYRIVEWVRSTTHDYADDPETREILGEDNDPIYYPETKAEDALWYPVVQVESDSVAETPATTSRLRAEPNELVPKTGWWHSQAKPNGQALHYFEAGQRFPDWHTTHYGSVIWGYDPNEQKEPPKK